MERLDFVAQLAAEEPAVGQLALVQLALLVAQLAVAPVLELVLAQGRQA